MQWHYWTGLFGWAKSLEHEQKITQQFGQIWYPLEQPLVLLVKKHTPSVMLGCRCPITIVKTKENKTQTEGFLKISGGSYLGLIDN